MSVPKELLAAMVSRLEAISGEQDNNLLQYTESIQIINETIQQLKVFIETITFETDTDEIDFFKSIKPQFDGRLIYFSQLLTIEQQLPQGIRHDQKVYYRDVLRQVQRFYDQHHEFTLYHRMEATHLDVYYFLRKHSTPTVICDDLHLLYDQQYHTRMSCKMARMIANDLLKNEINLRLRRLRTDPAHPSVADTPKPAELSWTASITAMVELIYALEEYGVFNDTKVGIKKVAQYFSRIFNVPLTNIYKIYENNRLRKKSRTPFLDALRNSLLRRMDHDDEFAL